EVLSVRVAVNQSAAEAEVPNAALQFVCGRHRRLHGKMRETGVAARPLRDLACQHVVRFTSLAAGCGSGSLAFHTRRRPAGHRSFYSRPVHRLQAKVTEISQPSQDLFVHRAVQVGDGPRAVFLEAGSYEVLFERYLLHGRALLTQAVLPRDDITFGPEGSANEISRHFP